MSVVFALLLNALLVLGFGAWLRAEHRRASPALRRWLLPTLAGRVALTLLSGARPSPDLAGPAEWSQRLLAFFWEQPSRLLTLLASSRIALAGHVLDFYPWSSNWFFYKLLFVLSIASNGQLWLNGLYLSLACFTCCWLLVRTLARVFPATPVSAGALAFLAWPPVLWWTAGLTKETILVGAGAGLVALALPVLYARGSEPARPGRRLGRLVLGLLLAWAMVRTRYFFALPLLAGLLALAGVRLAARRGWLGPGGRAQVGGLALLLAVAAGPAIFLGNKVVRVKFLVDEVGRNYQHGLLASAGRPHLEYADWQATPLGLLRHAPLAAAQVLVRPWPGEATQPQYLAASLENLLLLSLVVLALAAAWRGRAGRLPAALVAVLLAYCALLAAFIGLSTPNLGTLSRYRAAWLPWLLLLLLQNDYAQLLLKKLAGRLRTLMP